MKILYDHSILCLQPYGGVSRYFYEIANRLAAAGNDVELFAPLYVNEYFRSDCMVRPRGIKINLPPPKLRRVVTTFNAVAAKLLVRPRRSVDIFHETYFSVADCCPRSAKRVLTVYDMIYERYADYFSPHDRTRYIKAHVVKRADHIICISENTRRDLIELLGVAQEKTSVVHLGCSLAAKRVIAEPSKVAKPFILYVGSRWGYKNFDGLLRAYSKSRLLKNHFSIICFGGGNLSGNELTLMESLGILRNNIAYMVGNDDVLAGLYTSASVFVYPSKYEGFGIPPLEAMAFGCPVVCANTSSLPEVVGEAAELFDPADEEAIGSAIERVVRVPGRAQQLIASGYERIKLFSWEKCAKDTLSVYNKLLQD